MNFDDFMEKIATDKAKEIAINLYKNGVDIAIIARAADVGVETVKTWIAENETV